MKINILKKGIAKSLLPILRIWNFFQIKKYNLNILNTKDSLCFINKENYSLSRFGDGEFDLIIGKDLKFQNYNPELGQKLKEILEIKENIPNLKIAIPSSYKHLNQFNNDSQLFWIMYYKNNRKRLYAFFNKTYEYLDSQITRIYINRRSYDLSKEYFNMWKRVWDSKDVLIVEGEKSRFGIGNDLFENTKSIKRILCPAENAFDKYAEIIKKVKDNAANKLVLLVLGPTATIMAYDLAKSGIRALDIGNMDMEYEWFTRKTYKKIKIEGKYSLEVTGGTSVTENIDKKYVEQIICKVL